MDQNAWRSVRALIRYVVYVGCGLIVLFAIVICVSFFVNPFAGFAGQSEFSNLSGYFAKHRLSDWPSEVDPRDVQMVSYRSEYSRDSYSSWYRITLSATAAEKWMNQIHKHQEEWSLGCVDDHHEGLEGVRRTVAGPPPLHHQTGESPVWWTPPSTEFRATEVMLWYANSDSGVGRATYTSYDEFKGVLWMYDYACQHDTHWVRGDIPIGSIFTSSGE